MKTDLEWNSSTIDRKAKADDNEPNNNLKSSGSNQTSFNETNSSGVNCSSGNASMTPQSVEWPSSANEESSSASFYNSISSNDASKKESELTKLLYAAYFNKSAAEGKADESVVAIHNSSMYQSNVFHELEGSPTPTANINNESVTTSPGFDVKNFAASTVKRSLDLNQVSNSGCSTPRSVPPLSKFASAALDPISSSKIEGEKATVVRTVESTETSGISSFNDDAEALNFLRNLSKKDPTAFANLLKSVQGSNATNTTVPSYERSSQIAINAGSLLDQPEQSVMMLSTGGQMAKTVALDCHNISATRFTAVDSNDEQLKLFRAPNNASMSASTNSNMSQSSGIVNRPGSNAQINRDILSFLAQNPHITIANILATNQNQEGIEALINKISPNNMEYENVLNSTNSNQLEQNNFPNLINFYKQRQGETERDIEKAAFMYRNSASLVSQRSEAKAQWTGNVSKKMPQNVIFSRKVFLGGVPWDITTNELVETFRRFGDLNVHWPNRDGGCSLSHRRGEVAKGYCYLVFENEASVKNLIKNCSAGKSASDGYYFRMASPKFKCKDVQVIPWVVSDSVYMTNTNLRVDTKKTVFVGALHGMITAETLFTIMDTLFGDVVLAALDTDKYKYPIGSGRVAFDNMNSYFRAVMANFVDVQTSKFRKTIQIDPYLEDSMCNNCFFQPGIYFCKELRCFRYLCPGCWQMWHSDASGALHKPLRRSLKSVGAGNSNHGIINQQINRGLNGNQWI